MSVARALRSWDVAHPATQTHDTPSLHRKMSSASPAAAAADSLLQLRTDYRAAKRLLVRTQQRIEARCRADLDACDANASGTISATEFTATVIGNRACSDYETVRAHLSERMREFRELDADGDYEVTLAELVALQIKLADAGA